MPVLLEMASINEDFFIQQPVSGLPSDAKKDADRARGKASCGLYRVLVVEDDPFLLEMYSRVLSDAKLPFDQSSNGHDALEKLSTTFYNLVITDLNLPGLDGISLLQWIQHHRPATTAIVISGDGSADRILAAMRGGAKDYLVKPFSLSEFREMIDRWSQSQRPFNPEVFSSLMKQVTHDAHGEVLNLEIMIKMLQHGKFGGIDARVNGALLTMQAKLDQLKGLTTDYSLLARNLLQRGGDIQTERIGLKEEVISQVLGELQDALQRKEIKVTCSQDLATEGDAYVMGNRVMLKSVFRNLFNNAIRHCPAAGALSYGITNNGRRYKIYVANEGEIVPAHLQSSIFDEFVRVRPGDPSSCQSEGLGLGLALAKDILRQHGGDIWYESLTNGSKFVCTMPPCPEQPVNGHHPKPTRSHHMRKAQRKVSSTMSALLMLGMLTLLGAPAALASIADPEYTGPILDPATQNKWATAIPNALMAAFTYTPHTAASAVTAGFPAGVCGVSEDCYTISVKQFQQDLGLVDEVTGLPLLTTVNGYGTATNAPAVGPFVGSVWHAPSPTIRSTSNRPYRVTWLNELPNLEPPGHDPTVDAGPNAADNYPYNRIVTHMHGAHVQDDSDGYPEAWFTPGFTLTGTAYETSIWGPAGTYRYENTQEAATIWYHDHASGLTHTNTHMGMAGFSLITDNNEKCLQGTGTGCTKILPTDPYEVGFALQDRNFWPDGSIAMPDLPVRNLLDSSCESDSDGEVIPETCPTVQFSKAADGHLVPYDATIADPLLRGPFTGTSTTLEYFGNMPLVNGVVYGKYDVEPRVYRMRFIGGTDSRTWVLQLEDRATPGVAIPFWQIGSEQGFLNNPVQRTNMDLLPGERLDVLVNLTGIPVGHKLVLKNLGPDSPYAGPPVAPSEASTVIPEIMEFAVVTLDTTIADVPAPTTAINLRPVNGAIVAVPAPTAPVRNVSLIEVTDEYGRTMPTIDNRGFMQMGVPVTETIQLNDVEQWDIINTTVDAHPIHLHLVAFQVIDRQALPSADPQTGETPGFVAPITDVMTNTFTQPSYTTTGPTIPPEAWEAGWKDTIDCPPGMVTRVKAKFDIAGNYVWHCHILSHEEHDMMRPFTVVDNTVAITPIIKANTARGTLTISSADELTVTANLNPGSSAGADADWWVAAETATGFYHWSSSTTPWLWQPTLAATYQGPMAAVPETAVFNSSNLTPGTYTLYFALDTVMDGLVTYDHLFFDSVVVTVTP